MELLTEVLDGIKFSVPYLQKNNQTWAVGFDVMIKKFCIMNYAYQNNTRNTFQVRMMTASAKT